jgi:lipoate-protein ligase A
MPSPLRFEAFRSSSLDPLVNLAFEEVLLEAPLGFEAALFLYVDEPSVIIGRNQNPWAEVSPDAGAPVLRRVSGGGTVFHDRGNLNWALVLPRSRHDPEAEIGLVADVLAELGVATSSGPRGGLFVAEPSPFAGRKLSGTARRLSATRVLHHGTLLVDADLKRLRACLGGMPISAPQALVSVPGEPLNLAELLPGITIESAASALALGIAGDRAPRSAEAAIASTAEASGLFTSAKERLASWDWTWGATPRFEVAIPSESGTLRLFVCDGRVSMVEGPGADQLQAYKGEAFSYEMPAIIAKMIKSN